MRLADLQVHARALSPFGLAIEGVEGLEGADYLHEGLLTAERREAFFDRIDREGIVVCRGLPERSNPGGPAPYRDVRGRSSRGRLSPGEYFHHDGCAGPTNPRVVEIRCPHQDYPRDVATAVARFPDVVYAQLRVWAASAWEDHEDPELDAFVRILEAEGELPRERCDAIQGRLNRWLRRHLDAERARAYFRRVDEAVGAFVEPWERGESRFIANENATRTCQHRRAYQRVHEGGRATGRLIKRWPGEEFDDPWTEAAGAPKMT